MEKDIFKQICETLDCTVKMKIEQIRRFLNDNRASVMVGAGFSKNADRDESVSMKGWNELDTMFFKSLYCKEPQDNDFRNTSTIRLASQVEASFGKNTLEEMIRGALPDDRIWPSSLHKQLMILPWCDVFTTNYVTLLERAAKESNRNYNTVTNKESLLYKKSPRIIKLHWSFPNITPFMPDHTYWWLTTDHPSRLKTLHVKSGKIKEEKDTYDQKMNFFDTKEKADKLLELVKDLFRKKGFALQ